MISSLSIPLLSVQLFPYGFEMMIFLKESSMAFSGLSSESQSQCRVNSDLCLSFTARFRHAYNFIVQWTYPIYYSIFFLNDVLTINVGVFIVVHLCLSESDGHLIQVQKRSDMNWSKRIKYVIFITLICFLMAGLFPLSARYISADDGLTRAGEGAHPEEGVLPKDCPCHCFYPAYGSA